MDRRKLIHQLSARVFDALELNPPPGVNPDEVRAFRARHEAAQRASLYEQFKHLGAAPAPGQRGHPQCLPHWMLRIVGGFPSTGPQVKPPPNLRS